MSEKLVIKIGGMSCNHCRMSVEKALKSLDGVLDASVDLHGGSASIEYDPKKISDEQLKSVVRDAGYQV